MPEKKHHAHHLDFSFAFDWRGSWTDEVLDYLKKYTLWYAAKHETGQNGKVHLHVVMVNEILSNTGSDHDGAMTASNRKAHMLRRCPTIQAFLAEHGSKHSICAHPCRSDKFIEYMQKEGDLVYHKLPKDIVEMRPYFADLLANKPLSSDYEKWANMYRTDLRAPTPTFEDMWQFFGEHMYNPAYNGDIKVVADMKKLTERCEAMVHYVNGTVPSLPKGKQPLKRKAPEKYVVSDEELTSQHALAEQLPKRDPPHTPSQCFWNGCIDCL